MSLRVIAQADTHTILTDAVTGAGWAITLTNPAGSVVNVTGFSNDIEIAIDPDTGQAVTGRTVSVALHMADLTVIGIPQSIHASDNKPWLVGFDDQFGNSYVFKVVESHPDRTLGVVTCFLEFYE